MFLTQRQGTAANRGRPRSQTARYHSQNTLYSDLQMLFFDVFLRETARPVAKNRTNLAQIQESYQTAGPIDTKFGTHVQTHLGMDFRGLNIQRSE